jgi:hypothetical protein
MDLLTPLLKLIGFLSIPLVALSVFLMIRSIGRATRITSRGLLIQLGTAPVFLLVYSLILGVSVALKWAIPLVILGAGVGGFWGFNTLLTVRGSDVFGTRSIWYLVLWGASFALTQLMALTATDGVTAGGMTTMCFSMGTALGMNGGLLIRRHLLLSEDPEATPQ